MAVLSAFQEPDSGERTPIRKQFSECIGQIDDFSITAAIAKDKWGICGVRSGSAKALTHAEERLEKVEVTLDIHCHAVIVLQIPSVKWRSGCSFLIAFDYQRRGGQLHCMCRANKLIKHALGFGALSGLARLEALCFQPCMFAPRCFPRFIHTRHSSV